MASNNIISRRTHNTIKNETGDLITRKNEILVQNKLTQECLFVRMNEELVREFQINWSIDSSECDDIDGDIAMRYEQAGINNTMDSKIWSKENILFFIDVMQKYDKEFSVGMRKQVWQKVAKDCCHLHNKIDAKQCETKWKSLKRTYKNVLNHNNTSGQKKRWWEFFDAMNRIMFNKPEIIPIATCSSMSGLKINKDHPEKSNSGGRTDEKKDDLEEGRSDSSFAKKRKLKSNDAERRHKEKMERLDIFNNLFEKMVEKL